MLFVDSRVRVIVINHKKQLHIVTLLQDKPIANLNEEHLRLLSTNLSVREVKNITCRLTFQNKAIILDVKPSNILSMNNFYSHRILGKGLQFLCTSTEKKQSDVVFPKGSGSIELHRYCQRTCSICFQKSTRNCGLYNKLQTFFLGLNHNTR